MTRTPLNDAGLRDLALAYVARYATTRKRLTMYLARKVRERGVIDGAHGASMIAAAVATAEALGGVDDAAFAASRQRGLERRGYGRQRIEGALRSAGIDAELGQAVAATTDDVQAAIQFLRRRRLGPFGSGEPLAPDARRKALAAMARAGHPPAVAQRLLKLGSPEELEQFMAQTDVP